MSDDKQTKALAVEIKDADRGEVEAIVATLGVVDRDNEIILNGAIKDGAKVKLSAYGHDAIFGEMPVGKGAIHIENGKAVFRGRFFLSTSRGADAFSTVKEMGPEQEWSFGFRVLKWEDPDDEMRSNGAQRVLAKLDAFEVSPVVMGAGIGTRTLSVKEAESDDAQAKAEAERVEAEAKAKAEAEAREGAEADRLEAEAKVLAAAKAAELAQVASEEFERFERTRKLFG